MTGRAILAAAMAAGLAGCATVGEIVPAASARDCAVMMLAAGFIAEHQPPLHLQSATRDLEPLMRRRGLAPEAPETWSPDADAPTIAAIGAARRPAGPPERTDCPLTGSSPFEDRRPGGADLTLSRPAYSPKGDFAVLDAVVRLPRRMDAYRFMLSGPPEGAWDLHRIEFQSTSRNTDR